MNRSRHRTSKGTAPLTGVVAAGLCLLYIAIVWAGVPTEQLRTSVDQVIVILQDPSLKAESKVPERRAAVRKEADNIFDFEETAKRALGPHWQKLTEPQRREFVSLFTDLLERAYLSKIDQYSGEKLTYVGDTVDGDLAIVRTRFVTKNGTEVPVEYRMVRRGDRWLVYDVVIEGISLVNNYRSQFNKIIQTSSYDELVSRMKTSQFSAPGSAKSPRS